MALNSLSGGWSSNAENGPVRSSGENAMDVRFCKVDAPSDSFTTNGRRVIVVSQRGRERASARDLVRATLRGEQQRLSRIEKSHEIKVDLPSVGGAGTGDIFDVSLFPLVRSRIHILKV